MANEAPAENGNEQPLVATAARPSTLERAVERSTIHIDAAACIKWFFLGTAILVIVVALVWSGRYDLAVSLFSLTPKL